MTNSNSQTAQENGNNESHDARQELAECLLSQYRFCASGVGLGAVYGIKRSKGFAPMVIGGLMGTVADFSYGYMVECVNQANEYEKSRHKFPKNI